MSFYIMSKAKATIAREKAYRVARSFLYEDN